MDDLNIACDTDLQVDCVTSKNENEWHFCDLCLDQYLPTIVVLYIRHLSLSSILRVPQYLGLKYKIIIFADLLLCLPRFVKWLYS